MHVLVNKIIADKWNGLECREETVDSPTANDLDRLINALDSSTRTIVMLHAADGSSLTIGGGQGKYIVYAAMSDDELWNLVCGKATNESVEINIGGQMGEYPATQVVGKALARQAAQTFLSSGNLDDQLSWLNQP